MLEVRNYSRFERGDGASLCRARKSEFAIAAHVHRPHRDHRTGGLAIYTVPKDRFGAGRFEARRRQLLVMGEKHGVRGGRALAKLCPKNARARALHELPARGSAQTPGAAEIWNMQAGGTRVRMTEGRAERRRGKLLRRGAWRADIPGKGRRRVRQAWGRAAARHTSRCFPECTSLAYGTGGKGCPCS